jgi:hypothetical protein
MDTETVKKVKDMCPVCNKKFKAVYVHLRMKHPEAIARLSEDHTLVLAEKDSEIASLKEQVAQAPTSIADFPAEDQAAYFKEFLKTLSDEDKAVLAEETGFGPMTSPLPATNGPEDIAELAEQPLLTGFLLQVRKIDNTNCKILLKTVDGKEIKAKHEYPMTEGMRLANDIFSKVWGIIFRGEKTIASLNEISTSAPEPVTETTDALEEKQTPKTVLVIGNRKFFMKG